VGKGKGRQFLEHIVKMLPLKLKTKVLKAELTWQERNGAKNVEKEYFHS
jgi:predicted lipid carrier protein YhbT